MPTGGGAGGNLDLKDLPGPVQLIVRAAYGDSFGTLFLIAAAVSVLTLVAVLLVREVPLRNTVELRPEAAADSVAESVAEAPVAPDVSEESDRLAEPSSVPAVGKDWDDPTERLSVAALNVLTAAQDQARQHVAASAPATRRSSSWWTRSEPRSTRSWPTSTSASTPIREHLNVPDDGASLGHDGAGADSLRAYEYGLLVNSQRTADKVTRVARLEAERILTEADEQVAELETRIRTLRAVEAELSSRVAERVRTS